MSTRPARGLSRVLEDLGPTLLDLLHGEPGTVGELGGVGIHDPHDEQHYPERAIVLGVGVHGTDETVQLLGELGELGAAALVVRGPVEGRADLAEAAAHSGVALLALTRGASWAQLAAMLRTLLSEGDVGEAGEQTLGGVPSGDLFALANAIATLLDAPITIEDRGSRILAFSGRQDEADPARVASILARRVPERYLRIHEEHGVFEKLYRSELPVHIPPPTLGDEAALPRVAIAVRAGGEILGSVWATVRQPLTKEREEAFREAAGLVALHMLRHRAGADAENRLRADLVGTALEGGSGAVEALGRLGLADEPLLVLALGLEAGAAVDHAEIAAERQRLTSALAVHLTAVQPRSAVALLGDVAYAVVPAAEDSAFARERAVQVAANFLERTGERTGAVIGIGSVAAEPAALARSRANADRALRVLFHGLHSSYGIQGSRGVQGSHGGHGSRGPDGGAARRVAAIGDVHIDALLLEMRDLAIANRDELSGPLAELAAYDARHGARLVETLRAWLDAFGDVIAASASVFVHPNTFRYRIRRVSEVGGLDLGDPATRFAAMLQLRLMGAYDGGGQRD
ncbi:PucR family transcriptional regulator [Streptomyces sp. NPDC059009]|uniref:PucR family transcriptional regulator n=1 Tax=Streptomyces sp. NPDC059009 TaxID=3346694 RepID=UPI0036A191C0